MKSKILSWVRFFRPVYTPLLHFCFVALWPLCGLRSAFRSAHKTRRVLLVTQNQVACDHMRYISDLLRDCRDISQYVTTDWVPPRDFDKHDIREIIDQPYIHVFRALIQHWDLIIFTNHPFGAGIWFSPGIAKLYINHGIHTGKINNEQEEDGVYGRSRVIRPFNAPYYSRMFAASDYERTLALKETPELDGLLAVTGFLRADDFVARAHRDRPEIRKRFGYASTDKVVHIISTWGAQSLYGACGERMLEEIRYLADEYSFIFSLHPRFDEFDNEGGQNRRDILRRWEGAGIRVNRDLNWEDCVAAADMAIADHSSLCLYHILLDHPVLLLNVLRRSMSPTRPLP